MRMVFAVVVISELLAIVLTLSPLQSSMNRWNDLSIISLFVQWVGLSSAGVLCLTRSWLAGMTQTRAATISYLLLLLTTLLMTELAFWVGGFVQLENWQPNFWQPSILTVPFKSVSSVRSQVPILLFWTIETG